MSERMIFKYLLVGPTPTIALSLGTTAIPLHVGPDPRTGRPTLWAEVSLNEIDTDIVTHEGVLVGTGRRVPTGGGWCYVGTVHEDVFVWHIYLRPVP